MRFVRPGKCFCVGQEGGRETLSLQARCFQADVDAWKRHIGNNTSSKRFSRYLSGLCISVPVGKKSVLSCHEYIYKKKLPPDASQSFFDLSSSGTHG